MAFMQFVSPTYGSQATFNVVSLGNKIYQHYIYILVYCIFLIIDNVSKHVDVHFELLSTRIIKWFPIGQRLHDGRAPGAQEAPAEAAVVPSAEGAEGLSNKEFS